MKRFPIWALVLMLFLSMFSIALAVLSFGYEHRDTLMQWLASPQAKIIAGAAIITAIAGFVGGLIVVLFRKES